MHTSCNGVCKDKDRICRVILRDTRCRPLHALQGMVRQSKRACKRPARLVEAYISEEDASDSSRRRAAFKRHVHKVLLDVPETSSFCVHNKALTVQDAAT